ncbi:MAG: TetR/AcrR family transcriptional regulator [Treponema sp.]|nr:TetR/AcrR family transcriptional regulator [Treponema sp.]
MSIVVEHEKRRHEILEKALDVFMDEGFEDVTFQKIADRCGITRTTLYIYFKNKRDIFNYSIKQMLQGLEDNIAAIRARQGLSHTEQLVLVMTTILEKLQENQRLLIVVLNYLSYLKKGDHDPDYRVRRRTVRLRHFLNAILIEGIRSGEFALINLKEANEALYGFLEAAVFRLSILHRSNIDDLKKAMTMLVRLLAVKHT